MEEQYLRDLFGWISSQDPTFEDRYSFNDFATNMQDDPQYVGDMYNWISSVDNTFPERYTIGAFMEKVSAPPQTRPKKKEPFGIRSGLDIIEEAGAFDPSLSVEEKDRRVRETISADSPSLESALKPKEVTGESPFVVPQEEVIVEEQVEEEPQFVGPQLPTTQERQDEYNRQVEEAKELIQSQYGVIPQDPRQEGYVKPRNEEIIQETIGSPYGMAGTSIGMFPKQDKLRTYERESNQSKADKAFQKLLEQIEAPFSEILEEKDRVAEENIIEEAVEGRRRIREADEFVEDLSLITPSSMDKEEDEAVSYFNEIFGKYGFTFRTMGTDNRMKASILLSDGSVKTHEINLQPIIFQDNESEEATKLKRFVEQYAYEPDEERVESSFIEASNRVRDIRPTARFNEDGTASTVLMQSQEVKGKYLAYPTLFPVSDDPSKQTTNPSDWIELDGMKALEEAEKRGEVFVFSTAEEAEDFASGAWKDYNRADSEAYDFFREKGYDYLTIKEQFETYEDARDKYFALQGAPQSYSELSDEERFVIGEFYDPITGQIRQDRNELSNKYKKTMDGLSSIYLDSDIQKVVEDYDIYSSRKYQEAAQNAVNQNAAAAYIANQLEANSYATFGVSLRDLHNYVPKSNTERFAQQDLLTAYEATKRSSQMAAQNYMVAETYLSNKFDENLAGQFVEDWSSISLQINEGWNRGQAGEEIIKFSMGITGDSTEEIAKNIVEYMNRSQSGGDVSREMYRWNRAKGYREYWDAISDDPGTWMIGLAANSISQMLPYGLEIIPSFMATFGLSGAAIGSAVPGVGTAAGFGTGLAWGARGGFAATGFGLEYTNAFFEALANEGYDISNVDDVVLALNDEAVWATTRERGLKRGIPIATVDLISSGLAGRVFKVGKTASRGRRILAQGAERIVVDPLAEGYGEYLAQKTVGDAINMKEILAEMGGGLGNNSSMAAVNTALDLRGQNNLVIANDLTTIQGLNSELKGVFAPSPTRLTNWATKMEKLGQISSEQNQRIQENLGLRNEALNLLEATEGNITSEVLNRTMTLMSAKNQLESNPSRKQIFSNKIADINAELAELVESKLVRKVGTETNQTFQTGYQVNIKGVAGVAEGASVDLREDAKSFYMIDGKPLTRKKFLSKISDMSSAQFNKLSVFVKEDQAMLDLINKKFGPNAIQEQKTRTVSATEQAGTVQEVETQVRDTEQQQTTGPKTQAETEQVAEAAPVQQKAPAPIKYTKKDETSIKNKKVKKDRLDGILSFVVDKQLNEETLTDFEKKLLSDNNTRVDEIVSLKTQQETISELDQMIEERGGIVGQRQAPVTEEATTVTEEVTPATKEVTPVEEVVPVEEVTPTTETVTTEETVVTEEVTPTPKQTKATKKIKALEEEKSRLEDEVFTAEDGITEANEEIANTKSDLKEETARLNEEIKKVRASKLNREEKAEAIEDLKAQKEDAKQDAQSAIEGYKDDIRGYKADIRQAKSGLKKNAKAFEKAKTTAQVATKQTKPKTETTVTEEATAKPMTKNQKKMQSAVERTTKAIEDSEAALEEATKRAKGASEAQKSAAELMARRLVTLTRKVRDAQSKGQQDKQAMIKALRALEIELSPFMSKSQKADTANGIKSFESDYATSNKAINALVLRINKEANKITDKAGIPRVDFKTEEGRKVDVDSVEDVAEKINESPRVSIGLAISEFIERLSNNNLSNVFKLTSFINKSFPQTNISIDQETFDRVMEREDVRKFTKKGQIIYGVTVDGDIYLNPQVHNYESALFNTAIHEMGHVWSNYLQTTAEGRKIYAQGVKLVEQTETYQQQLRKFNGDKKKAANEAIAILIGNKGETIVNASLKSKFSSWLTGMWTYIKSQFKQTSELTAEEIQNLTLDEFLGSALADIFAGKEIKLTDSQMKQMKNPEVAFSSGMSINEVIEMGRDNLYSDTDIIQVLYGRGFSRKEINEAMVYKVMHKERTMPDAFKRIEGGILQAAKLYTDVHKAIDEFAYDAKGRRVKTYSEIRQKAQELMKAHPVYEQQSEQVQMEILTAFDSNLGYRSNSRLQRKMANMRAALKQRRIAKGDLKRAQAKLRNYIRQNLPRSKDYTQVQINKLIKLVNQTTDKNFQERVERVIEIVDKQRAKMKRNTIAEISKVVASKAKTRKQGKKRRAKGVDALTQLQFAQIKKVLDALQKSKPETRAEAMEAIKSRLDSNSTIINEAIAKIENGEEITSREQQLVQLQLAYDTFADIETMTLEEVQQLLSEMKKIKKEGILKFKTRRLQRAADAKAIQEEATEQIQETNPLLFNEDGKPKGRGQLEAEKNAIRADFSARGIVKKVFDTISNKLLGRKSGWVTEFKNVLTNVETVTNFLDNKAKGRRFFTERVYNSLNRMSEVKLQQIREKRKILNQIAIDSGFSKGIGQVEVRLNSLFGLDFLGRPKTYRLNGLRDSRGKSYSEIFNANQLLRIYALSKNEKQRAKLKNQGVTNEMLQDIENQLGPDLIRFADNVVEYLSTQYYEETNSIYRLVNGVNLGYIENYFPTKVQTDSSNEFSNMVDNGDFLGTFSAQTASALKDRVDNNQDIDLTTETFIGTLMTHIETIEKFKAYAVGVQRLNDIFKLPVVNTLMEQSSLKNLLYGLIMVEVNPMAAAQSMKAIGTNRTLAQGLIRKYVGYVLSFKPIQVLKQMTSFVSAYRDYNYFPDNSRLPQAVKSSFDLFMFPIDYTAALLGVFAKDAFTRNGPIAKAREMSATFNERFVQGFQGGDVYALESGTQTFKKVGKPTGLLQKARRAFNIAKGGFTALGDILGVLGYYVNYKRNIANGMTEAEALEAFNQYDATQQPRRSTNKAPIQLKSNIGSQLLTTFMSVTLLQINRLMQNTTNIAKSIKAGKMPRRKDIRGFVVDYSIANVLFTAASNIALLTRGDDEDKEIFYRKLKDAAIGLNILYNIPLVGVALEEGVAAYRGERAQAEVGVNPISPIIREINEGIEEDPDNFFKAYLKPLGEFAAGAKFDSPIALMNYIQKGKFGFSTEEEYYENMYDIFGISSSYRPGYGKRGEDLQGVVPIGGFDASTKSDLKRFDEDLYEQIYGEQDAIQKQQREQRKKMLEEMGYVEKNGKLYPIR